MAERSIRFRTTRAATAVVAVTLLVGGVVLVWLLRGSLVSSAETLAEDRAESWADQIDRSGLPRTLGGDEDDEPADLVVQVSRPDGTVVLRSPTLTSKLPLESTDSVKLPGADHPYVVEVERADRYVVSAAATREEADDATRALVPLLLLGLPVLLAVVAAITWTVTGRALAPVDGIRRRLDQIADDSPAQRVAVPGTRDEIQRLAVTMNRMLERLDASRQRQRRFVSDASHELRTPLASLRQSAEVATAHPGSVPEGELAELVLADSIRMQVLVEQLLLLSRMDQGDSLRRTEVDLDDIALAEAGRWPPGSGVALDARAVGAVRVHGDAVALGQVVRNLLDNARRHAEGRVGMSLREDRAGALLVVEDDGAGVPPGERERIFERFVRLDEARARDDGGSGLGLALVAEIVTAHGGTVVCGESSLGGARFEVRIPVS